MFARSATKSILYGCAAAVFLLGVYFATLTFVSGWAFTLEQFSDFWYFVVALALGFGVQIGLYIYLRDIIHGGTNSGNVLGVTGTTSATAMISCCAHYLVNLLPILGVTGLVAFVAQYQVHLFWFGLLSNGIGILYIANRINKFSARGGKNQRRALKDGSATCELANSKLGNFAKSYGNF
ncbi:MAG: hypothetical protein Q7S05_02615 [bacterium]|nr:hypothetical protein [bacterium]